MSGSSPDDLAIAFRSITRRWREVSGAAGEVVLTGPQGDLNNALQQAAALMGSAPTPEAIADAIQHRPAAEWSNDALDQLRAIALEVGAVLRQAARLADQG